MEPLQQLQAKISGFPGYGDDLDRRHSDVLVRAYLGERLAELAARLAPVSPDLQQRIDALLLRLGFADPKAFAARNGLAADGSTKASAIDGIAADDLETIEIADRAGSIDASTLHAYLDDVTAAVDRRDAAMRAAASPMS